MRNIFYAFSLIVTVALGLLFYLSPEISAWMWIAAAFFGSLIWVGFTDITQTRRAFEGTFRSSVTGATSWR